MMTESPEEKLIAVRIRRWRRVRERGLHKGSDAVWNDPACNPNDVSWYAWASSYVEETARFMQELAREAVKVSLECYGEFAEAEAASTRGRCEREVAAVQTEAASQVSQRFRHDRVTWRHIEAHEVDCWLDRLKRAEADVLEDARDAVEEERLKRLARRSAEPADEETRRGPSVRTRHVSMNEIAEELRAIAPKECTILLTGEPGTGEGHWARRIHEISGRDGKYVPVLCPTVSKNLFESELFGHKKGAFTGADDNKEGFIEAAVDGTLFLDEIAELPPPVQAKLLYLLQERTFRRVGETEEREAQCRIILATNRDLRERVNSGAFREDLLSRISTFAFHLLPLRERRDEIPELLKAFQEEFSPTRHRRISAEDCRKLRDADHDWPGNIRTLRAAVERAFTLPSERYVSAASILDEAKKLASAGSAS
jgi:transcriptional regulator with GAF, ATPase, and Fis domain